MSETKIHKIGVIMNGVTGRMGTNQHLIRSIYAIMQQGGIALSPTERIMPDPLLVGRNALKLESLSKRTNGIPYTTDLDAALANPNYQVYFDSNTTDLRVPNVKKAIAAGKHVYCEKPTAGTTAEAMELYQLAKAKGVKHGVVQDKLWLPGLLKLKTLIDTNFFGRIFCVKGEFGYWVFEGQPVSAQRPSWNYRKEDGGGIIIDMLCHWRYVLDNLFGSVQAVSCLGTTCIPQRWDESNKPYKCTADDAAYATFQLAGGVIAHFNSSWCTRVRRDDLLTVQVDGTHGSAVAGLRNCWVQHYGATPRPVWNPDIEQPINFLDGWQKVPEQETFDNAFKVEWELFLKHIVQGGEFKWSLREAAKGVQLAEKGIESWQKRAWVDIPELPA